MWRKYVILPQGELFSTLESLFPTVQYVDQPALWNCNCLFGSCSGLSDSVVGRPSRSSFGIGGPYDRLGVGFEPACPRQAIGWMLLQTREQISFCRSSLRICRLFFHLEYCTLPAVTVDSTVGLLRGRNYGCQSSVFALMAEDRDGSGGTGSQRSEASAFEIVAIEEVVGVKRDETTIGVNNMDARFFDGANVESIGIQKTDNEYAENIFVIQLGWNRNTGQAAAKLAKAGGTRLRGVICGKKLEQAVAHAWFLFIDDGIAGGMNQHIGFNETSERRNFAVEFQRIGHGQGIRMARHGYDILGTEQT